MLYNDTLKHIPIKFNQLVTTRIIPFSKGGLYCTWEVIEGDTRLRYEISVTRRSRVSRVQSVNVLKTLNASSLQFLHIRRCLMVEWRRLKRKKKPHRARQNKSCTLQNTLEHPLIILDLVPLGKNPNPRYFDKIRTVWELLPRTLDGIINVAQCVFVRFILFYLFILLPRWGPPTWIYHYWYPPQIL